MTHAGTAVSPFTLEVPAEQLADLHERLRRTRLPEGETVADWSQGVPLAYLSELCDWWREEYDWRRLESELNSRGQWRTEIDGLDFHFLHVRSDRADARPLLITHGWPGSVVETLDVLDGLVNPPADQPAFHVVAPSLPGFGFSDRPEEPGWGLTRIADAWAELMSRLDYQRFLAQGGDWGAMITTTLAIRHPERVAMMHTTVPWAPAPRGYDEADLTERERRWLAEYREWQAVGRGYALEQATRPQTVGYGLVDSPAGQLAWIVEKFFELSDSPEHPEQSFSRERMIDNVSVYWLGASAASSARLYWESHGVMDMTSPVTVPAAVSVFPREMMKLPVAWVEARYVDLRYWNDREQGGHFAMLEAPSTFVAELRAAFADAPS